MSARLALVLVLSLALTTPSERNLGVRIADPAAALALSQGIQSMIGGLQQLVQQATNEGDRVLATRLADAETRLRSLLPALDSAARGLRKDLVAVTDNASGEALGVLRTLGDEGAAAGVFANQAVNEKLADISRLLNVFTNVPPTLLAVSPSVIQAGASPREIRLTGFLPGTPNKDIQVSLNDKPVTVTRAAGHALSLALPTALVRPGTELKVRVAVREYWGWFDLFWTTHTFEERVRVSSDFCFSCSVRRYRPNPKFREEVSYRTAYVIDASTQGPSNTPNVSPTVSTEQLFMATMGAEAENYDVKTATLVRLDSLWAGYGADNCGQGPSFRREPATGYPPSITYYVSAPMKEYKTRVRVPRGVYICDKGGTHGVLTLRPVFLVARKSAQPLIALGRDTTITFGLAGTSIPHEAGARDAFAYHVECVYAEHGEKWSTERAVVTDTDAETIVRRLRVRVAQDKLLITPMVPAFANR